MSDQWEFSATIEDDGDLCLEWYKSKGNVVTVCLSAKDHVINWASLVESVPHHGCIKGYPGIAALGEVKAAPQKGVEECKHLHTSPGAGYNRWCDDCGGMLPESVPQKGVDYGWACSSSKHLDMVTGNAGPECRVCGEPRARRWNEPIAALVLHPGVPTPHPPTVKCSSCGELPVPDYKIALGSTLCIRCSSIVKAPHGHTAIPQWQLVGTKYGNLYRCTLCGITERRESAKSMPQKGVE